MSIPMESISRGKHILIITPGFPENESDDNCIPPLQEYLNGFSAAFSDTKFSVITLHYPYIHNKYQWNGIPVFPMSGKDIRIKKPFIWLKVISAAQKLNTETKIDLIHSFWLGECAMLGNSISKKFNIPHICTLMGQDAKFSNFYQRLLNKQEFKIVAASNNQADVFLKRTNRKADEIIHWGISDQMIVESEREIDLLGAGSLIPIKNYSLLVKIVEEIKNVVPDIKCVIAGSGPEEAKLRSIVKEKQLERNATFAGLISRKEVLRLMQRSKILIHPSKFEGFGYVFAEALANGMNIVSFNIGAAREHPKWLIAKDEEDFINLTHNLLTTSVDYNSVNLFPLDETIERYASIYGLI